jgi:aminoglycoside phosphotransferase
MIAATIDGVAGQLRSLGLVDDLEFMAEARGRSLFCSTGHHLFVRLDDRAHGARATTEVESTRWAHAHGLPVLAPDPRVQRQPIAGPLGMLTVWPLLDAVAPDEVEVDWFGRTLRRLHDQSPLSSLQPWSPGRRLEAALGRLRTHHDVNSDHLDELEQLVVRLSRAAEAAARRFSATVVHGDASLDNVVRDGTRLLLTDFELAPIGPPADDLAPVHMLARRFGMAVARRDAVVSAYGRAFGAEVDEAMTLVHEVAVTTGAIAPYAAHPVFAAELQHRMDSLREDLPDCRWTPHRVLLARVQSRPDAQS